MEQEEQNEADDKRGYPEIAVDYASASGLFSASATSSPILLQQAYPLSTYCYAVILDRVVIVIDHYGHSILKGALGHSILQQLVSHESLAIDQFVDRV